MWLRYKESRSIPLPVPFAKIGPSAGFPIAARCRSSIICSCGISGTAALERGVLGSTTCPRALWIHDGATASQVGNSVSFYNIYLNGNHIAGGQPLVVESLHGNSVGSLHFYGTDWGHPGSGQFSITLNGHASGAGVGVNHIDFHGIYLESNSTDTSTAIASIIDATDVNFDSVSFNRLAAGSTAPGLAISESAAAKTFHITATGFRVSGGSSCTGTITNSVPGLPSGTQNGCSLNHYSFISSEDANSVSLLGPLRITGSAITIASSHSPSTAGGQDIGTAALPFGNLWLGTAATNNFKFAPAATAAARTVTIADPLNAVTLPLCLNTTNCIIQSKRGVAGCATGASAGAVCTTTVTWNTAFADTNYTASCMGNGITSGVPVDGGITSKAAGNVVFQTVAVTAAAAQYTNIECVATHD